MYKRTFKILLIIWTVYACTNTENRKDSETEKEAKLTDDDFIEDDYIGDDENRSYELGKITFIAIDNSHTITHFGIDPFTSMMWFTPESGAKPMAGVIFKSADFKSNTMVNLKEFDTMLDNYKGEDNIENSLPLVSYSTEDITYQFNDGVAIIDDFSRKTGKVKLRVEGTCSVIDLNNPANEVNDMPAALEIDAFMPFANVDGSIFKTEAAEKFKIE